MRQITQAAAYTVMLKVFLSSDHVTAATGKTVAVKISKAGGAFADPEAGATNATEVSSGWYKVALDSTDSDTTGDLVVRGTATACDDSEQVCQVVSSVADAVEARFTDGTMDLSIKSFEVHATTGPAMFIHSDDDEGLTVQGAQFGGSVIGATGGLFISDGSAGGDLASAITNGDELHTLHGLSIPNPVTVTPTLRTVGTISQTISGDGVTTSTVTRTA